MKRREFLGTLTSAVAAGTLRPAAAAEINLDALTRTPLVLMALRPDGFEAVWGVTRLCKGRIEWQSDDGSSGECAIDDFGFVPQGDEVIRVSVSGLKPGVSYRVRSVTVGARDGRQEISPWKRIRTLDPSAETTHFAVWNDTHINDPTIRRLDDLTPQVDFLVWNGDTCNDWTSPDLLVPTLLHPGGRDITQGRPLFLTWGNHDVRGPHAYAVPQIVRSPGGRPFHAIRSGPVAALCLHTGEDKPDTHPSFGGRVAFDQLRKEQTEWIARVLSEPAFRDAPYRVVFCHIPLRWLDEGPQDYDNGGFDRYSRRSRDAWHEALVDWKAQIVISGHTHRHAWMPPTPEFPYGQLTGGGPQPRSATWITGHADADRLKLEVHNLDDEVIREITLRPVA